MSTASRAGRKAGRDDDSSKRCSRARRNLGGLAALPGLETVTRQIADLIAVLRAEQARRRAGIEIRRPAWKNLVFTGGPGTGKSRAARALAGAVPAPRPAHGPARAGRPLGLRATFVNCLNSVSGLMTAATFRIETIMECG